MNRARNIQLLGGFVDGSGREGVYKILTGKGYKVSVVQNPTLSPAGDAAALIEQAAEGAKAAAN